MKTGQRILKNFLSLLLGAFFSGLIGLLTHAYLARIIGPSGFGKIGFAMAIVTYFMLITDLGLSNFGIREIAKNRSLIKSYVSNILSIKFFLSIIAFALLLMVVIFIPKPYEIKSLIFLFGLGLIINTRFISWVYQGLERMEIPSIMQPISSILYLVFILLLIKSPSDLLAVPIINLGITFLVFIVFLSIFIFRFGFVWPKFDFSLWKSMLSQSLPMGISIIMIQIYYNFDTILLGFLRTNQEVGFYTAAYKIILVLIGISSFFYASIYPVLSRFYANSRAKFDLLVRIVSKHAFIFILPLTVLAILNAGYLINLIFGADYTNSIIAFQILIIVVCIIWIAGTFSTSLNAIGRQGDFLKATTSGALLNIVMDFALIPRYGIVGAAIATAFSEILVLFLVLWFFNAASKISIDMKKALPFAVIVCIVSILLFFVREYHPVVSLIVLLVSYFPMLFMLKVVSFDEIMEIKEYILNK